VQAEGSDRERAAQQIIDAFDAVMRWWVKDFKPGRAPDDLTWTQFEILCLAENESSLNMSQLAERLDLTVPTVVRAVDALTRKGLVERQRASMKQRDVTLATTPDGRAAKETVESYRHDRLLTLLEELTEDEVTALVQGFRGMARVTTGEADDAKARDAAGST
jgi:DNA-binding MarR family transcriptional regulator